MQWLTQNSDPRQVDFVIPANDDASKSINKILSTVTESIAEGLESRQAEKEGKTQDAAPKAAAPVAETAKQEEE